MNDPNIFREVKCGHCKKRVSTRLCDFVVSYDQPIFYKSYEDMKEQELYGTCDFPLCDKCTTKHNRIYDFCPHHAKLVELIKPTK